MKDRRTGMRGLIYSRRISSAKIVLTRYIAQITTLFLPVILLAIFATAQIAAEYPGFKLHLFAFIGYSFGWLLPTLMVSASVGTVMTELTDTPIGIILLTPVFLPEQSGSIRDVVESKATATIFVYSIRIGIALFSMLVLIAAFVLYMKGNGCTVSPVSAVFGTFSGSVFLGALGLFVYKISDTLIVGYMVPMVYYMLNLFVGKKYFGKLYLFSMSSGNMSEKYWLISVGMFLILFTLILKNEVHDHLQ